MTSTIGRLGLPAVAFVERATPPRARRLLGTLGATRVGMLGVLAVFVVSRAVTLAIGVRPRESLLLIDEKWQVLDPRLLDDHLVQSLWYLHMQPPLFNLGVAILNRLPGGAVQPVSIGAGLVMGLVLVSSTYLLLVELRVWPWLAFLAAAGLALSPSTMLYENWIFYTYPTATLLSLGALACARFLRTSSSWWGLLCVSCIGGVVLLNSTFQLPLMVALVAVLVIGSRRAARAVLLIAALPLVIVVGWYAKNAVLFGSYTTSSWFGMNFARTTLLTAPPGEVASLVHSGRLTPLALDPPFEAVSAYGAVGVDHEHSGVGVLDEVTKSGDLGPNLNDRAIIAVSNQFLHDDLAFIRADPSSYLHSIANAVKLWFAPPDQYIWVAQNRAALGPYATDFDHVLGLQPSTFAAAGTPAYSQLSYSSVIAYLLVLFGAPILVVRRRRERAYAMTLAFLWCLVAYAFVLTSLVEFGENNRFRYDLGGLPALTALVVALEAIRALRNWRRRPDAPSEGGSVVQNPAQ